MAGLKNISDYYLSLEDSFIGLLKKTKNLKEKDIHELRVAIKHLKALLQVSELLNTKIPASKVLKRIKPVFKAAGHYRTNQLNIQLLKKHRLEISFSKLLKEQHHELGKKLLNAVSAFDKKAFKKYSAEAVARLKKANTDKVTTTCLDYVDGIKLKCKKKLKPNISNENLHELRKELKTIKTSLQLLMHINPNKLIKTYLKEIAEAETLIGKWHDNAVFYEMLLQFKKLKYKSTKLLTLLAKVKIENATTKQNVIKSLDVYLNNL